MRVRNPVVRSLRVWLRSEGEKTQRKFIFGGQRTACFKKYSAISSFSGLKLMEEFGPKYSKFKFESLRTNKRNSHFWVVISSDVSTDNYLTWLHLLLCLQLSKLLKSGSSKNTVGI